MPTSGPVTVIIPAFNRAQTLPRALYSCINQTRPPDQIIVVDDGSTDDTSSLISKQFPQVDYIHQPNQGVSTARNTGIRQAIHQNNNAWIALLDSDDEWLPNKLERQLAAWQMQPQHRLIHCDEIWIRDGRRVNARNKHRKHGGHIFHHCLPLCAISPSATLLQRSLLDETGLFNESLPACEDYDLWLRICHREAVLLVDEPLIIKYGGHADQLSRQHWGMDRFRTQALRHCIDHEKLSTANRQTSIAMLLSKLDILIQGAAKRNQHSDVRHYQQIKEHYNQPDYVEQDALLVSKP
jgi:glycosyltransferase involved in cell wall biosynthesis